MILTKTKQNSRLSFFILVKLLFKSKAEFHLLRGGLREWVRLVALIIINLEFVAMCLETQIMLQIVLLLLGATGGKLF